GGGAGSWGRPAPSSWPWGFLSGVRGTRRRRRRRVDAGVRRDRQVCPARAVTCQSGARTPGSELGDLRELELDRRLPAEDVDQHLEPELVLVDLDDLAGEVGEGPLLDPDRVAQLVLQPGLGPGGGLLLAGLRH